MTLAELASWLRCPRCFSPLEPHTALVLGCVNGHRFDANKRGYLNALDPSRGVVGDTATILAARADFLALGHYSPIADAVADRLSPGARVVDSGCGTGYYLGRVLERTAGSTALALDASVAAVASTTRSTGAPGLVADVWRDLPIRDARADVITCVFAPRNPAEFARVLAPAGRLIVVTPAPNHLAQLRDRGDMIGIQDDKLQHLDAALSPLFALEDRQPLERTVSLDAAAQGLVAGMGPSGHHATAGRWETEAIEVTIAVDVSVFARS